MRRRRKQIITIGGTRRELSPKDALRFEVVRDVLVERISLYEGALRLGMDIDDLAELVVGARQAVIRALGEQALENFEPVAEAV
ncbi:MAG TPA: hypothetical protein VMZ53_28130 [Kofleriaceae bacterium]|nr:hypothetical protein [Kofleriaceae bacterium]